jgi:8-oxo-dGTP pyrophosphatase MutT (NUDIX family)
MDVGSGEQTCQGTYVLPKGTLEKDEDAESTAAREIAEEAGVRGRLIRKLGIVERPAQTIIYYLFWFRNDVTWAENRLRQRRWVEAGATPVDVVDRLIGELRSDEPG